jgi:adenylate cyclase
LPLIALVSYVYAIAINYITEKARKQKVLNAFRKYVAPQIVEEISKKGEFEIELGGRNRDIAVLFVDIRGFTTMSEALEPETVVEILNEYLSLTTKAIFDNSGTLDKFVGDATMAVFNSPFDLEDYVFKAVCAAMDIVKGGEELEKVLFEKYGRSVGFGVGVNCGPAVVGNVGCDFRMDYTAIGDTVNTSARLEANAKKGQVLISDEVYRRLEGRIEVKEVGELALKGKSKGFMVYEVVSVDR